MHCPGEGGMGIGHWRTPVIRRKGDWHAGSLTSVREAGENLCFLTFGWSIVLGNFRSLVLFILHEASGRAFAWHMSGTGFEPQPLRE